MFKCFCTAPRLQPTRYSNTSLTDSGSLVTKGFRHLIEIARQSVPDGYGNSFFWVKPRRLVPLHLVREVAGPHALRRQRDRTARRGGRHQCGRGTRRGRRLCIAICLLHSYANDAHEKRVGELIAERFPNVFVSLSSVVLPEYREYERAMTTLIDVLVKPYCRTYLQRAADKIKTTSGNIPFLIMQSNGGIVKHSTAGERPVTMLLSGPAAGVLGSVHTAQLAGYRDILTIDVGGTSTDVSIIENHQPRYTSTSMVESYPVKTPMLDIVTVGSGGGSIVWTDSYGQLKVGPQSAGANPGPDLLRQGRRAVRRSQTPPSYLGGCRRRSIGGEIALDAAARNARVRCARRAIWSRPRRTCRRRSRNRRRQPSIRHSSGDHHARPRTRATMQWSRSAAPAACLQPRSRISWASAR